MAATSAGSNRKPPAKGKGGLSGDFHGVPKWLIAIGGGGGAFLIFRWWKNRNAASSTTASGTGTPAASSTGTSGAFPGTGTGSGGGGGTTGGGPGGQTRGRQKNFPTLPDGTNPNTTPQTDQSNPAVATAVASANPTAPPPGPLPTAQGLQSVSVPVAPAGSTATGAGGNPNGTAGTFSLPKGVLDFQPTAAIVKGNQVAYGIGNPGIASKAESLGGTVVSGTQLEQKGWTGVNPGAKYLLR